MGKALTAQRALAEIERTLANDHPGLGPMFAIFTRLAAHEAMPVTERVTARRWRRGMRPAAGAVVGLAMVMVASFAPGLTPPSSLVCPGTAISATAPRQSVPADRGPACASRADKRGKVAESGLHGH